MKTNMNSKNYFSILLASALALCGNAAWAAPAAESDFTFDPTTGTITGYKGAGGDVEIPATIGGVTVTAIGGNAFVHNDSLKSVTIPASVTNIWDVAFASSGMTNVTFAAGSQLKTIGGSAFNLTWMKELTIPASVREIGTSAFARNESLLALTFEEGSQLEVIGDSAFNDCYMTNAVVIPASVKHIGYQAFSACLSAAAFIFAEGSQLETIGGQAFLGICRVKDFTIPASVTNIGNKAFSTCDQMTNLTVLATTPPTAGEDLFQYCPSELKIRVPEGTAAAYKAADGWSAYADLITDGTIETTYFAWNGTEVTGPLTTNATPVTADMTTLNSGWYVVQGQVVMPDHGLVVNGDAHLILCDEAKLAVTGAMDKAGIEVAVVGSTTNSLTIYGQETQSGRLEVAGGEAEDGEESGPEVAAIGGSREHLDCGRVTIDGGTIVVPPGCGAGIGSACRIGEEGVENVSAIEGGFGGVITINGGTVVVEMGTPGGGAGLGGGMKSDGGSVTINGGTVRGVTYGNESMGPGIGAGMFGGNIAVTINDGTVDIDMCEVDGEKDSDGGFAAAIGASGDLLFTGGCEPKVITVTINGGTVTARSCVGAGIGTGLFGVDTVRVVINGGTVFAEGGYCFLDVCGGAGIGGGSVASGADVLINGGTVTAISHPVEDDDDKLVWSSGIGAGYFTEDLERDYGPFDMGTFALGPNTTATILSGMDTNGFDVAEVQAADYGTMANPGWCTNCYVKIEAVYNPVSEGSPAKPWKVGVEGSEDTVQAHTNGTGKVIVTGAGTPKTFAAGEEPWAGAVPAITEIVVPREKVDVFKTKWPAFKDLITDGIVAIIVTNNGTTTNYYDSVQAAFDSEFTANPAVTNTVTMIRDYTETTDVFVSDVGHLKGSLLVGRFVEGKGVLPRTARLDLNGHTLMGGGVEFDEEEQAALSTIVVAPQSVLIIDDSSDGQTGSIRKPQAAPAVVEKTASETPRFGLAFRSLFAMSTVANVGGDLTLASGTVYGEPVLMSGNTYAIGVFSLSGRFRMDGGLIVGCAARDSQFAAGVAAVEAVSVHITGGKVRDSIFDASSKEISISGGLFGTSDVFDHPEWVAKDYVCAENDDSLTRAEGYLWKVFIPSEGTVWNPWKVGPEGSDYPQAHTNQNGELVIEGKGPVTETPWAEGKDGITEITITDPGTELPEGAFDGMGGDDDKIKLNLPDNWKGELPDEDGNWYGAKAEIANVPFLVRNVKFLQRYPWNGLVDITADLMGYDGADVEIMASVEEKILKISAKSITGQTKDILFDENHTAKAKLVWDANYDFKSGFRSEAVTVILRATSAADRHYNTIMSDLDSFERNLADAEKRAKGLPGNDFKECVNRMLASCPRFSSAIVTARADAQSAYNASNLVETARVIEASVASNMAKFAKEYEEFRASVDKIEAEEMAAQAMFMASVQKFQMDIKALETMMKDCKEHSSYAQAVDTAERTLVTIKEDLNTLSRDVEKSVSEHDILLRQNDFNDGFKDIDNRIKAVKEQLYKDIDDADRADQAAQEELVGALDAFDKSVGEFAKEVNDYSPTTSGQTKAVEEAVKKIKEFGAYSAALKEAIARCASDHDMSANKQNFVDNINALKNELAVEKKKFEDAIANNSAGGVE